jgi:hypothetical protein
MKINIQFSFILENTSVCIFLGPRAPILFFETVGYKLTCNSEITLT